MTGVREDTGDEAGKLGKHASGLCPQPQAPATSNCHITRWQSDARVRYLVC